MASELDKYDYIAAGIVAALERIKSLDDGQPHGELARKVVIDAFTTFNDEDKNDRSIELMADGVLAMIERETASEPRDIVSDALRVWVGPAPYGGL